jgi:two-component system alkaline phosphatase synthesis response regulator PhoP
MRSVLIADDEEDVRQLIQLALKSLNYNILSAKDGLEALETAREAVPQLAILDAMMPNMDGFEVCRKLKDNPLTAGITMVMLTARSQDSDRARGDEAGPEHYITKPFSPAALRNEISSILSGIAQS